MHKISNLLIFCDALAALASHVIGKCVRLGGLQLISDFGVTYVLLALAYTGVVLLCGYFCEIYAADRYIEPLEMAARISVSIMMAFFVLAAGFYAAPDMALGRGVLSLSLLVFGVLQYILHRIFQSCLKLPHLAQKVMVLGVGPLAELIERTIPTSPHNFLFAGFIKPESGMVTVPSNQIIGTVDQVEEILLREKIHTLVVSITERRGSLPVRSLLTCKMRGFDVMDSPSFYEKLTGKLLIEDIQPSWFIYSNGFRVSPVKKVAKRALDLLFVVLGLLLVLPAMPLIALAIKWSSSGPVFFKQRRVGERGVEFTLIKFRTMFDDAERQTGPVWASEDDPRVTKLGNFLRKTRIDEIPQLFNVLKGEMSFIGPRPERKEFVEKLSEKIPYYGKRHFTRPGITGWAQVRYAYGASTEDALEKLRYDLYYIKNFSLTLDLRIVLETVKVVLFRRGGR